MRNLLICGLLLAGIYGCDRLLETSEQNILGEQTQTHLDQLQFKTLTGATTNLNDYRGKLVLINFWATWCPPCIAEMPALNELHLKFAAQGFTVLGINVDQKQELVEEFLLKNSLDFPIVLDPDLKSVRAFGVTGFPESVFISQAGKVLQVKDPESQQLVSRIISDREWANVEYFNLVKELLNHKHE